VRQCYWVIYLLTFCLPALALAQYEPPEYLWTIGYDNGVTVRRFLGDNWEVYLGGGPNDSRGNYLRETIRDSEDGIPVPYSDYSDDYKTEEGHVHLGAGHTLVRDGRLWLVGVLGINYRWSNFQ
jgi:hypothetical protein